MTVKELLSVFDNSVNVNIYNEYKDEDSIIDSITGATCSYVYDLLNTPQYAELIHSEIDTVTLYASSYDDEPTLIIYLQ